MLPTSSLHSDLDLCNSSAYTDCPAAKERLTAIGGLIAPGAPAAGLAPTPCVAGEPRCPFLHESLAHWCSAAPVVKFIPYSDALLSRCNSEGHHHCLLYVQREHPSRRHAAPATEGQRGHTGSDEPLAVPGHLAFSSNHMWLDAAEDGSCTVGIDAFLARVLGQVDQISFAASRAVTRPAATLTLNGIDLTVVFPNQLELQRCNAQLRAHPGLLVDDPYGAGWLFEGSFLPPLVAQAAAAGLPRTDDGLLRGEEAQAWMRRETDRLSRTVHELVCAQGDDVFAMDGGTFARGMARELERESLLAVFKEFFALAPEWRM